MWQPHIACPKRDEQMCQWQSVMVPGRKKWGKWEAQVQINVCVKHPTSSTGLKLPLVTP